MMALDLKKDVSYQNLAENIDQKMFTTEKTNELYSPKKETKESYNY